MRQQPERPVIRTEGWQEHVWKQPGVSAWKRGLQVLLLEATQDAHILWQYTLAKLKIKVPGIEAKLPYREVSWYYSLAWKKTRMGYGIDPPSTTVVFYITITTTIITPCCCRPTKTVPFISIVM